MATYKVPQNVEADDQLLGPFSFRQVVYLAIAIAAGVVAWGLSKIFIPLAILPVPIILVFLVLALPLRKDQPMEIYAAAILSYLIKPRKRLWYADGVVSLIEVVKPSIEEFKGKGLTEAEASERLNYLSQLVDTQGWAVRGLANAPTATTNLADDVFFDSQSAEDILDENSQTNQALSQRLADADTERRDALLAQFQSKASGAATQPDVPASTLVSPSLLDDSLQAEARAAAVIAQANQAAPAPAAATSPTPPPTEASVTPAPDHDEPKLVYSPYPNTMRQSVIHPIGEQPQPAAQAPEPAAAEPAPAPEPDSPRKTTPHPDIINLASNSDLSVETIAREAKRINKKYDDDEIVLQLH